MGQVYSPSSASDTALINPYVEINRGRSSQTAFDQTFTGSDLQYFIDVGGLGYFHNPGRYYVTLSGSHESGLLAGAIDQFLQFPTEIQPGTKPGIGTVILTAARILNYVVEEQTNHGLVYSDLHFAAAGYVDIGVEYVYEPVATAAAPEPATLTILGLGLAGLGLIRRKRAA